MSRAAPGFLPCTPPCTRGSRCTCGGRSRTRISSFLLGAPTWPPNPPTFGPARETRAAPLSRWGPRPSPPPPHPPKRPDRPGNPAPLLYFVLIGGPDMAPNPPNVRTGPGNPCRSSISVGSVGQDVPPDADAGEDDHHEQYPLESNAGQPLA